jgi:signal transduction histidine kinase
LSDHPVKTSRKIAIIVGIQIAIILVSFVILELFESQKLFLGNSVNIAGKNRFYTMLVLNDVKSTYIGGALTANPISTLQTYEDNLKLLRYGGMQKEAQLSSLDEKFHPQWNSIHDLFVSYQTKVRGFVQIDANVNRDTELIEISKLANELAEQNDILTIELGLEVQKLTTNLIWLQIFLSATNIGMHVFMIRLIYLILKKETDRLLKIEKLYTVGKMAAGLAHDLRNPLSVIKMTMSMLLTGSQNVNEETKSKYKLIENSANRMFHQIEDVMDFVRVRELQLRENSLKDIVYAASLTTEIPNNVTLNMPSNDVQLRCDRKQIEVLISNLLSNAVEVIGKESGIVTVRINEDTKNVIIEVEDSGKGIPEKVLPRIFEPLFTTKAKGTGLGLVSCKNIVDAHSGTIIVKNAPTRFIVTIPKN